MTEHLKTYEDDINTYEQYVNTQDNHIHTHENHIQHIKVILKITNKQTYENSLKDATIISTNCNIILNNI